MDPTRFSAPHNWCDGRCHRCHLIDECPLAKREEGRRWAHRMRGRDPDDPDVQLDDTLGALSSAVRMLEREARARGLEPASPRQPPAPTSLQTTRIRRAAMDHTVALHELGMSVAESDERRAELREALGRASALIGPKVARIAGSEPDVWECDGVPNLLLVERVDLETSAGVEAFAEHLDPILVTRYVETRERLRELLSDWMRALTPADLDEMDRLIQEERAPTPFARRSGDGDD
jgi:hypothetical protein